MNAHESHADPKPEPKVPRDGTRFQVQPGFEALLAEHHLDSLEALFELSDSPTVGDESSGPSPTAQRLDKPGLDRWRERLRLILTADGQSLVCYLKRFRQPPPLVRRAVRRAGCGARSTAGLEWKWARQLAAAGVPCLEPIALGEEWSNGIERRSALLTREVKGISLERWLIEQVQFVAQLGNEDPRRLKSAAREQSAKAESGVVPGKVERSTMRRVIAVVAESVARLHASGFVHRDLYTCHLFVDGIETESPSVRFIDLQRVIRPQWFKMRWMVKDLAALNYSAPSPLISRTDRCRWLRHYLGVKKLTAAGKGLAWRVVGKTARIRRHDRRRTARLGSKLGGRSSTTESSA